MSKRGSSDIERPWAGLQKPMLVLVASIIDNNNSPNTLLDLVY